ncbi:MAG: hypothetical protein HQK79_02195 [Desulfobacterales bacterium]|nr:hypothetical protein [Desulfobacterales bacterium]
MKKQACQHYVKGRIDYRLCTNNYQCENCEFDQYVNDQYAVHVSIKPVNVLDVEGFKIPHGFYLHPGHTWVKIEENAEVRVGIDDFALRLLGPIDNIYAPLLGKKVNQSSPDILLSRDKNEANAMLPISGVVTDVNLKLRDNGSLANKDPYSDGWILRIHADNLRGDLKQLMIGEETKKFFKKEINEVYRIIENESSIQLSADGGTLGYDIYGNLSGVSWERLIKRFLRSV